MFSYFKGEKNQSHSVVSLGGGWRKGLSMLDGGTGGAVLGSLEFCR